MNEQQWKKVAAWMLALFPAWNPDEFTLVTWFREFPAESTPEDVMRSVREIQAEKATAFPPGVFEILAKLKGQTPAPRLQAKQAFAGILEHIRHRGADAPMECDEFTKKVLVTVGGARKVGNAADNDLRWIERDFVDAWLDMTAARGLRLLPGQEEGPNLLKGDGA